MTSIISFEMDFTAELKIEREIWENRKAYLDIQKLKFFKFLKFILFKNFFIQLQCWTSQLLYLKANFYKNPVWKIRLFRPQKYWERISIKIILNFEALKPWYFVQNHYHNKLFGVLSTLTFLLHRVLRKICLYLIELHHFLYRHDKKLISFATICHYLFLKISLDK